MERKRRAGCDQHSQRHECALSEAARDRAQTLPIRRALCDRHDGGGEHHLPTHEERHRKQM